MAHLAASGVSAAQIHERLETVRQRISACGQDPDGITIVGVTKGHSLEVCRRAREAGLKALGENRVQEALPKIEELQQAEWHLVGHLQTNKAAQAAGRFALIQSVDSQRLVDALANRVPGQQVLVQVNVAREPQKNGVDPESAPALIDYASARLRLVGLMCMAPIGQDPRPAFHSLAALHARAQERLGSTLPILSMGMSEDFEAAVRAGSTMLRLGRILFGERPD